MTHTNDTASGESLPGTATDGIRLPVLTDILADELGLPRGVLEHAYEVFDRLLTVGIHVIVNGREFALPFTGAIVSLEECRFRQELNAFLRWEAVRPKTDDEYPRPCPGCERCSP